MSSVARCSSEPWPADQGSRAVMVLIRIPMAALSLVLILIAVRYLFNPVQAAAAAGIAFTSPAGVTVARVGFGAFPLGFVAFFLSCLFSPRRIVLGLRTELSLLAIIVAVRVLGMMAAHSAGTAKLLVPELVMAGLCMLAIRLETNRQKHSRTAAA